MTIPLSILFLTLKLFNYLGHNLNLLELYKLDGVLYI
jgi:hypothetical protein